jgi:glycosyltransferase involved in cell wall biosynthesis
MKVSVLVMTYNHAAYIRQALDSVLAQSTDFPVELLISEDCSTDGTREIVTDYHRQYPERIRLLLSDRNLRTNQVVARGIHAARGELVALLDGDDHWTSSDKLAKQVRFLDAHPECAICFHNARVVHEGRDQEEDWLWTPADHPAISTLADLWMGNFIATSSTVFRRGLIGTVPAWYDGFFPITDWPLHLLNAEHGHIGYLPEVMSVYRYHSSGCYSPWSEKEKQAETLRLLHRMNECMEFRHHPLARTAVSKHFIEWAETYILRGDFREARRCYRTYLTGRPLNRHVSWWRMVTTGLRLFMPPRVVPSLRHRSSP